MDREQELDQIKRLPPEIILPRLGIPYRRQGSQLMALAVWRGEQHPSVSIQIADWGHWLWRDHGVPPGWPHAGGSWIDLVIAVRACSYVEAVRELRSLLYSLPHFSLSPSCEANADQPEAKILRISQVTNTVLKKYLRGRGIQLSDLPSWLKELHYQIGDKIYYGLAIPTIKGGWQVRSPSWKGFLLSGGIAAVSEDGFALNKTIGNENIICITEGMFDALSLRRAFALRNFVILGGTSNIVEVPSLLARLQPAAVVLALDRDHSGREATQYLLQRINTSKVYSVDFGPHRDPNEALCKGYEMSLIDATHLTPNGARALARDMLSDLLNPVPRR